ncbi:MAG: response regulator transcription factor [Ignavibacteriaceae bacterium]
MTDIKKKILLVEDDINLGTILKDFLKIKNYDAEHVLNCVDGFNTYSTGSYDLLILDIMMPKKDGFTLATEIRKLDKKTPIIFLSAKSLVEDRIKGLKLGGDDYLTKPFSSEELLLRIENIFKRVFVSSQKKIIVEPLTIGKYIFDYPRRALNINGNVRKLTFKESELLRMLAINKNDIVDRSAALDEIWHDNTYFTSRSMDVYITKLRSYLKEDPAVEIVNIHGTGFKLLVH